MNHSTDNLYNRAYFQRSTRLLRSLILMQWLKKNIKGPKEVKDGINQHQITCYSPHVLCKGGIYSALENTILVMFDCLRYKKQKSNWLSVLTRGYRLQEVVRQEKQKHISGQNRSQVGVGYEPGRLQIHFKNSRTPLQCFVSLGEKNAGSGEESLGRHNNMPYSFHYRKTPPLERDKMLIEFFLFFF